MDSKSRLTARAIAATFLKSINTELIWCNHWETRRQAEGAILQYITASKIRADATHHWAAKAPFLLRKAG
jgi:hypothetical protein